MKKNIKKNEKNNKSNSKDDSLLTTYKINLCMETFIQKLSSKLDSTSDSLCEINNRIEAERIIKWCMTGRKNYICRLNRLINTLKTKAEDHIIVAKQLVDNNQNKISGLCGVSKHNASTESYFTDTTYNFRNLSKQNKLQDNLSNINNVKTESGNNLKSNFNFAQKNHNNERILLFNEHEKIINLLPLIPQKKKRTKSWSCDELLCNVNDAELINHYQEFLTYITQLNPNNFKTLKQTITCTAEYANPSKLGHPHTCYINFKSCDSLFISTLILSPHFPSVRYIKKLVYNVIALVEEINMIDNALNDSEVNYLKQKGVKILKRIQK